MDEVCVCACVHVCVCVWGWGVGGGGKVEEKTSTCTGFKPTTSQSARKAQHPEARWGGLTRWDRIDRIGLDMMSGSSGVECTLQAALLTGGGGGGRSSQPQPVPRCGHPLSYHVLYCSTGCFQFSFFPRTMVEVWDSLPWS